MVFLHGFFVAATVMPLPTQSLVDAHVTIAGKVDEPGSPAAELVLELPRGIGLTASERRDGVEPLNGPRQVSVPLDGSSFAAEMPIRYCTMRLTGAPMPAPPAQFVLRFSDSPDETYVVWRHGGKGGYRVTGPAGNEVPGHLAAWQIDVGPLEREDAAQHRWRLEIAVKRRGGPSA